VATVFDSPDGRVREDLVGRSADHVARVGGARPAGHIRTQGSLVLATGLVPSMTLACGTFGGTSTTDSITYTHLMNIEHGAHGFPRA
jgi:hypothetical protein